MANLRAIRRHVQSVRSIAKVTNAMEVVSAAKSVRLQGRLAGTQPYAEVSWQVLTHLAEAVSGASASAEDERALAELRFFYVSARPERSAASRAALILMTSNRGLVGAYNDNVVAAAAGYLRAHEGAVEVITVGRQGAEAMRRGGYPIRRDVILPEDRVALGEVTPLAQDVLDGVSSGELSEVALCYTQYRRGARLRAAVRQLLPFRPRTPAERREYIYEPDAVSLLRGLLPRVVRFQLFEAYLESLMAENTARVAAMRAATQNAEELIDDLSRSYNKARQAAITAELADLLTGSGRGGTALDGSAATAAPVEAAPWS